VWGFLPLLALLEHPIFYENSAVVLSYRVRASGGLEFGQAIRELGKFQSYQKFFKSV
jgi:hypothetical protein